MTSPECADTLDLRRRGEIGLAEAFSRYRVRLERLVQFRLDPRIRARVDAADVLQEAYIAMSKRLGDFLANPSVSCFVWMRQQTLQVMTDLHRSHFRDKRAPQRELHFGQLGPVDATSMSIARYLLDGITSPSQAAVKAEEVQWLHEALNSMNEIDREVLALRHFEQLSNGQVAEILSLSPTAASNRYIRAASRLAEILEKLRPTDVEGGHR